MIYDDRKSVAENVIMQVGAPRNCHHTIQMLLLSLTVCSWMFIFLSVTIPDNHVFREYHNRMTSQVVPITQEDPCDQCWVTPATSQGEGHGNVHSYYYFTLHSALSALRIRLQRSQKYAGKAHSQLESLESTVRDLHHTLLTQFSPHQQAHKPTVHNDTHLPQETQRETSAGEQSFSTVTETVREAEHPLACDEVFLSPSEGEEVGRWKRTNCGALPIRHIVSVVVEVRIHGDVTQFLESLAEVYYDTPVHLLLSENSKEENLGPTPCYHPLLKVTCHSPRPNATSTITHVLRHVTTPYVFIATGLDRITREINMERLVAAAERIGAWAVGASLQTPDGRWHHGCVTSTYKDFSIGWAWGNIEVESAGCLVCHHLPGPFLANRAALIYLSLNPDLQPLPATLDLFLRGSHHHNFLAASCPDSLFLLKEKMKEVMGIESKHVSRVQEPLEGRRDFGDSFTGQKPPGGDRGSSSDSLSLLRAVLLPLARKHGVYELRLLSGATMRYSCTEVKVHCPTWPGLELSPCCRQELITLVAFTMDVCQAHGLLCELQEGTLLGAVKMRGTLPWEKDADVTFHTRNFSALQELRPVFTEAGYSIHLTDNRWCCVEGRMAGGQGAISSKHWTLELWSQHAMDSEELIAKQKEPTKVEVGGRWLAAPYSPGLYVRNRYGHEVYRHAQHWLDTGGSSGWIEYRPGGFLRCPAFQHHSCLDQHSPDGNLQFDYYSSFSNFV